MWFFVNDITDLSIPEVWNLLIPSTLLFIVSTLLFMGSILLDTGESNAFDSSYIIHYIAIIIKNLI